MRFVPAANWRRQQWRAVPTIGTTDEIWIHHGAAGQPNLGTLRGYERHHVVTNGWAAPGYSWGVTGDGTIYELRGWLRQGAHTLTRNAVSHAVLLVGDWTHARPREAMIAAAAEIIRHGVAVGALTNPVRIIDGHRNAPGNSTSCPGDGGMSVVPAIRSRVSSGAAAPPPAPSGPRFPNLTVEQLRLLRGEEEDMRLIRRRGAGGVHLLHNGRLVGLKTGGDVTAFADAHIPVVEVSPSTHDQLLKAFGPPVQ